MITIRKSSERGEANHGWLLAKHTFSFANYYDPKYMGFGPLRVINQDRVSSGMGFGTHGHRDMEIITYIIEGELEHKDSMGNTAVIRPGEIQYMCAGTGVQHSEFNPSKINPTHLLQIWIEPNQKNHVPTYGEFNFSQKFNNQDIVCTISPDGRDSTISIHRDLFLYVGKPEKMGSFAHSLDKDRLIWVQLIKGQINVNGIVMNEGDGVSLMNEIELNILWQDKCEFILFDMK